MANLKTSLILNEGINKIQDSAWGSYYALRYFLPIYDPRIDDDAHTLTQTSTSSNGVEVLLLSASLESVSATYADLKGEKIFNPKSTYVQGIWNTNEQNMWQISDDRNFVTCATPNVSSLGYGYTGDITYSSSAISNTCFSRGIRQNLINGQSATSDVLSGNDLVPDGAGGFAGTNIALIPKKTEPTFTLVGGTYNDAMSMLYPTASYSPVAVSGNNLDAGRYAIRLTTEHGDFRFNKIVFFAVSVDSYGNIDNTKEPIPFSVSVFEGTVVKTRTTDDNAGLLWEGVFQLVFERSPFYTNLTNLMVTNWVDLGIDGFELVTSDKVIIFNGHQDRPVTQAKLTVIGSGVSGFPVVSGTPQLALGYDNDSISYISTLESGQLRFDTSAGLAMYEDDDEGVQFYVHWSDDDSNIYLSAVNSDLTLYVDTGSSLNVSAGDVLYRPSCNVTYQEDSIITFLSGECGIHFNEYIGTSGLMLDVNLDTGISQLSASLLEIKGNIDFASPTRPNFYNGLYVRDSSIYVNAYALDPTLTIGHIPEYSSDGVGISADYGRIVFNTSAAIEDEIQVFQRTTDYKVFLRVDDSSSCTLSANTTTLDSYVPIKILNGLIVEDLPITVQANALEATMMIGFSTDYYAANSIGISSDTDSIYFGSPTVVSGDFRVWESGADKEILLRIEDSSSNSTISANTDTLTITAPLVQFATSAVFNDEAIFNDIITSNALAIFNDWAVFGNWTVFSSSATFNCSATFNYGVEFNNVVKSTNRLEFDGVLKQNLGFTIVSYSTSAIAISSGTDISNVSFVRLYDAVNMYNSFRLGIDGQLLFVQNASSAVKRVMVDWTGSSSSYIEIPSGQCFLLMYETYNNYWVKISV